VLHNFYEKGRIHANCLANKREKVMFLVALMWAAVALSFPISKYLISYANPLYAIGFRMLVAGSCLLLYHFVRTKSYREAKLCTKADVWAFVRVGIFHIYLSFVPTLWALQYISSIKATILYSSAPLFSSFFSFLFFGYRLSKIEWLGLCLGFLGLLPTFFIAPEIETKFFSSSVPVPELMLLIAVVAGSYAWFEVKALSVRGYSMFLINGIGMLVGGVISLAHYYAVVPAGGIFPVNDTLPFLATLAVLILLTNILTYNLYGFLLGRYSFTFLAFSRFLASIFGVIFGVFFFECPFTWAHMLGFVFVLTGLHVFYHGEKKHRLAG
jgi:drug/metabolite transporter (DMT)-like permease